MARNKLQKEIKGPSKLFKMNRESALASLNNQITHEEKGTHFALALPEAPP
jgi:hypothetical protein